MRDAFDPCPQCGKPLPFDCRVTQIFCSHKCASDFNNGLYKEARRLARAGRTCPSCGQVFDANQPYQRFCSRRCRRRTAYWANPEAAREGNRVRCRKWRQRKAGQTQPNHRIAGSPADENHIHLGRQIKGQRT